MINKLHPCPTTTYLGLPDWHLSLPVSAPLSMPSGIVQRIRHSLIKVLKEKIKSHPISPIPN